MPDYQISANSAADMSTVLSTLSMTQKDGRRGLVRYSVYNYGIMFGLPYRAIVRWVPPSLAGNPFPPTGLTLPSGVAIVALPANSPAKFYGSE